MGHFYEKYGEDNEGLLVTVPLSSLVQSAYNRVNNKKAKQ